MIFSPKIYPRPVAEMILDGTKCCTRRLVKEGETLQLEIFPEGWLAQEIYLQMFNKFTTGDYSIEEFKDNLEKKFQKGLKDFNWRKVGLKETGVLTKKGKVKWRVGRDYSVCLGQGKAGLWYCPKCKNYGVVCFWHKWWCRLQQGAKPLRIVLTGISKQRLLDISAEDVKKEGFKKTKVKLTSETVELPARTNFLNAIKNTYDKKFSDIWAKKWNPEVWVLSFSVKGDN